MTRKDYILLADALRKGYACAGREQREARFSSLNTTIGLIADALAQDSARFDRDHFLAVVRGERDLRSRPSRKGNGL